MMIPTDRHLSSDELAELAYGVFDDAEATAVRAHMAGCASCMQLFGRLSGLPEMLASIQYPPIPDRTSERIEAALVTAARQRADLASGRPPAWRSEGVVDSAASLNPHDHLCWAYRSEADWADRAVEFAADGIVAGQRVELVGDASTASLRSELAELISSMPVSRAAHAGQVRVHDLADFHASTSDGIVDIHATVAARRALIDDALRAGYTGVRTVTDSTPGARTEVQRDAVARLEYLGDHKLMSLPICVMCSYDTDAIGPVAVAELACMHPFTSPGAAPFRLYGEHDADFGLAGSIDDDTAAGLFRTTLERTDPPTGNELIVDARRAELIGDRALAELNAHAARMGRTSILRMTESQSPSPEALSSLTNLRVAIGSSS
jgi:hypothetical protein